MGSLGLGSRPAALWFPGLLRAEVLVGFAGGWIDWFGVVGGCFCNIAVDSMALCVNSE